MTTSNASWRSAFPIYGRQDLASMIFSTISLVFFFFQIPILGSHTAPNAAYRFHLEA